MLTILVSAIVLSTVLLILFQESESATIAWEKPLLAEERIFPLFNRSDELYVLNGSGEAMTYSEQLALVSLQGIVNRELSRIYIDFEGESEKNDSLLSFLSKKHNVSFNHITIGEVFGRFSDYVNGIVVYDEANTHTVNIATTLSGIHGLVIADADLALELIETYGFEIRYDLRERPWSDLREGVSIYDEALSSLYPLCGKRLIAILRPDKLMSRDYVIATRSFAFYVPQGPMTSDSNIRFMEKVLRSTPDNIPILGWFSLPTGAEENYFIQMISKSGKMAIGGEHFPNLSVLSSFQSTEGLRQSFLQRDLELKNKVYLTISVPDGDSIDFMYERMREIWDGDLRGSIPISWSMEPLLAELAPVFLEYFYDDATPNDTFLAGPSGAGYIYPNFTPDDSLNLYLWRAKRLLNETDIDIVWLLNSFTSYETPYSPHKLDGYAQVLQPKAMILDYGDTPVRRSYWIQTRDDGIGVPVIRSTHAWGDMDNFLGKVAMEVETYGTRPHFLFVPIMPWTITLDDIVEAINRLNSWFGEEFEIVSVNEFFDLFKRAMIMHARNGLDDVSRNPITRILASDPIESAEAEILLAEEMQAYGDLEGAVAHASLASGHLQEVERVTVLTGLVWLVIALALVALFVLARRGIIHRKRRPKPRRIILVLQLLLGVSLFYLGFFHILYSNFWNYFNFIAVVIAVPVILTIRRIFVALRKPSSTVNIAASISLFISSGLVLVHGLAIGLVAASLVLMFSSREDEASALGGTDYLLIFLGGLLIAMFLQLQFVAAAILSIWLIAFSIAPYVMPKEDSSGLISESGEQIDDVAPAGKFVLSSATSLLLILLFVPFVLPQNHYFSLAATFNLPFLQHLGILALLSSILVAPLLHGSLPATVKSVSLLPLLVIYSIIWFLLFFSPSPLFLGTTVIIAQLLAAVAFLQVYDRFGSAGGSAMTIVSRHILLFVLFGFVVVMPPLSYSLYLIRLPSSVVFFLYSPPLIISAFSALVFVLPILVLRLRGGQTRKPST
ncbi:MAG: GxGYxYP domain-containing protein [Thermoplasmata archaeon]